jgi:hypothetical protein
MAATNSLSSSLVTKTVVRSWTTGGTTGKRNKIVLSRFVDATNGIAVGGNTNTIKATDFGMTRVERCSSLLVYTTSSGATVKVVPAVPSYDGALISLGDAANATAANHEGPADVAISSTQTGQITVEGV